jgi:hypothetical protein
MAGRLLTDKLTPINCHDLFGAHCVVWEEMGVEPKRSAIELKIAHENVEVGSKFESCHRFNLGNIKALVLGVHGWTGDYTMYACGEELTEPELARLLKQYPDMAHLVTVVRRYRRGQVPKVSVNIAPPHPWSRFRAFEDLTEGVRSQLGYLRSHQKVLTALMSGDAGKYNQALYAAGYYTADPAVYLRALKLRLATVVRPASELFDWGDVA